MTDTASATNREPVELRDVRVLVLSDQPLEGEALAALFASRAGADAHWVDSAARARRLAHCPLPTVMLWSARSVGRDAAQPVAALRRAAQLGLVMVVDGVDRDALTDLLDGAAQSLAVLRRSASPTLYEVVRALDEAHRGRLSLLDPEALTVLVDQSDTDGLRELNDAEREVADLLVGGLRNATIAERLYKSERTVEKHVANIFAKLGLCPGLYPNLDRRVVATRIVLAAKAGETLPADALDHAAGSGPH